MPTIANKMQVLSHLSPQMGPSPPYSMIYHHHHPPPTPPTPLCHPEYFPHPLPPPTLGTPPSSWCPHTTSRQVYTKPFYCNAILRVSNVCYFKVQNTGFKQHIRTEIFRTSEPPDIRDKPHDTHFTINKYLVRSRTSKNY